MGDRCRDRKRVQKGQNTKTYTAIAMQLCLYMVFVYEMGSYGWVKYSTMIGWDSIHITGPSMMFTTG